MKNLSVFAKLSLIYFLSFNFSTFQKRLRQKVCEHFVLYSNFEFSLVILNTMNVMKLTTQEGEFERTVIKIFSFFFTIYYPCLVFTKRVSLPHCGIKIYFLTYPDSPMNTHFLMYSYTRVTQNYYCLEENNSLNYQRNISLHKDKNLP